MALITWNSAVSGNWGTGSLWSGRSIPGGTDDVQITVDGDYDITIPDGDSRSVASLYQSAGTLTLTGNLTVSGSATIDFAATLNGGSTNPLNPQGVITGTAIDSTLVNNGLIMADTPGGTMQIDVPILLNNGLLDAANGAILFITSSEFVNLSATVLTGGIYEVDGNSAIDFATGAYDFVTDQFPLATVTVNNATIILNGQGSAIFGFDPDFAGPGIGGYWNIQDTLVTNDLAGTLELLGATDFTASNTLANAGVISLGGGTLSAPAITMTDTGVLVGYGVVAPAVTGNGVVEAQAGTLTLSGGVSATTVIQVDPFATLNFKGTLTQSIGNDGTIAVPSGTLRISGPVTGSGGYFINGATSGAATTLDLATSVGGDVAFNGAGGLLKIQTPSGFLGQIVGFGAGDTIDLVGLASTSVSLSGNTLNVLNGASVVDTLHLVGDYSGASVSRASDGAGGSKLTIAGVNPRDFAFEGATWASSTITWSLATFTYTSSFDAAHPFSHSINPATQAAEVAAIQLAFDSWAAVSGLSFVEVSDSSDPATAADIRVGWGDLLGLGGEVGQAAYQALNASFLPGTILRLEDPAFNTIFANPGVVGGLQYTGFMSTFYQIALHEIGHALGLGHSTDDDAAMFGTALGLQNQILNASDIAGIQALYGAPPPVMDTIRIDGAGADFVTIQFDDEIAAASPVVVADAINFSSNSGNTLPFTYTNGATIPALADGTDGLLLMHASGVVALPPGYSAIAIDSPAPVTVSGGSSNGQVVLAGRGGLAFNAGLGTGSVFAAGGNNLISVYPGAGSQLIQTGNGNDTIVVLSGDDTVNAGTGANQILTGKGNNVINSEGTDLIAAGDIGNATINAGANNPVAFFGPGLTVFNGGTGKATVVSTVGQSTVNSAGGTQIWLGSNHDVVNSAGADTIIGNAGAATINATAGNAFVFSGAGDIGFFGGSGATTILGSATGSATLHGGAGSVIDLSYHSTNFIGGTGSDTIAGFGGSVTVKAGAGGGVFLGGPAGANSITGGSGQSIILGGGAGDVLTAGTGAGDAIVAGAGAETINAAGSHGADKIYAGTGPNLIKTGTGSTNILTSTGATTIVSGTAIDLVAFVNGNHPTVTIQNFSLTFDYITLSGFPGGEMSAALAGQSTSGGTETLTLSDGTHIILQGVTGLSAANFL
ncbi:MAG: matrixin family metalloprotease [Alphaproteobacteria bacterium]|nr:matrixin family metalloprotease [Alphaproteobacteria bacterium]